MCFFLGSAVCLPAHCHVVLHLCHHWNAGKLQHDYLDKYGLYLSYMSSTLLLVVTSS